MTEDREDITPTIYSGTTDNNHKIADAEERKETLTNILRSSNAFPALIKTGHVIHAIDTLNRMDGLYSVPFGFNDNRVINILCDSKTAGLIACAADRTKVLAAGRSGAIPGEGGDAQVDSVKSKRESPPEFFQKES